MPRAASSTRAAALLLLLAAFSYAQNDLPNLSTVTGAAASSSSAASSSAASSSASSASSAARTSQSSTITTAPASTTEAASTTITQAYTFSNAPSLYGVGIPTLIVPDTAGAPFMQRSSLPEGTVFICVGAVLGFLGAAVLAWRGIVAYSLQRSVRRAADAKHSTSSPTDSKSSMLFGPERKGYTSVFDDSSDLPMDTLAPASHRRHSRYTDEPSRERGRNADRRSHNARASSGQLFFSPTAGAGATQSTAASARTSRYLPAGYYAASSATRDGATSATVGGQDTRPQSSGRPLSLGRPLSVAVPGSNEFVGGDDRHRSPHQQHRRRQSSGQTRLPDEPARTSRVMHSREVSGNNNNNAAAGHTRRKSKLDQLSSAEEPENTPPRGSRGPAPSAFLEDLFEHSSGMSRHT